MIYLYLMIENKQLLYKIKILSINFKIEIKDNQANKDTIIFKKIKFHLKKKNVRNL